MKADWFVKCRNKKMPSTCQRCLRKFPKKINLETHLQKIVCKVNHQSGGVDKSQRELITELDVAGTSDVVNESLPNTLKLQLMLQTFLKMFDITMNKI